MVLRYIDCCVIDNARLIDCCDIDNPNAVVSCGIIVWQRCIGRHGVNYAVEVFK